MAISITDAVNLETIARTDPFSTASMFKDPSAIAATQVTDLSSTLSGISNLPGLDSALQTKFTSLTSTMSDFTSGISASMADRMKSFNQDMSTVAGAIDLFDTDSPCDFINSAFGTIDKIDQMINDAMASVKKFLKPISDALGSALDAINEFTDDMVAKLHDIMDEISDAVDSAITYMNDKLNEFKDMVNKELEALGKMFNDLVDLSYLSELRNLSICGKNVIDAIMV